MPNNSGSVGGNITNSVTTVAAFMRALGNSIDDLTSADQTGVALFCMIIALGVACSIALVFRKEIKKCCGEISQLFRPTDGERALLNGDDAQPRYVP